MTQKSIKVVIIGDTQVGKSCILARYVDNCFNSVSRSTVGAAFSTKIIEVNGQSYKIQIWDTAGQEKFRTLTSTYYRNANAAIIVFDLTNASSLENVDSWFQEIREKASTCDYVVLCGNKCDDTERRVITPQQGQEIGARLGAKIYAETSAKTGEGINEIFEQIVSADLSRPLDTPVNVVTQGLDLEEEDKKEDLVEKPKKSDCC